MNRGIHAEQVRHNVRVVVGELVRRGIAHDRATEPAHGGIAALSLIDLVELACDWRTQGPLHVHAACERLGIDAQLTQVLINTLQELDALETRAAAIPRG